MAMENSTLTPEVETAATEAAEEPKARINIDPLAFEVDAGTMYLSLTELQTKIDGIFKNVFVDYIGCQVVLNDGIKEDVITRTLPRDAMHVELWFRENTAEGYHVLKRVSEAAAGKDILTRMSLVYGGQSNRRYMLDDDAMQALEEFLPEYITKNTKKVNWTDRYFERQMTQPSMMFGYNPGTAIEVKIVGFPIDIMLKKLFGAEIEGKEYQYACQPIRSNMSGSDFIIQVTRLDIATTDKLARLMGFAGSRPTNFYGNGYMHIG